uniref:Uncharacterized protein n=1 Tax=Arundo donax TaxID=35708 RepID=A0A0A8YRG2_ARUDO
MDQYPFGFSDIESCNTNIRLND